MTKINKLVAAFALGAVAQGAAATMATYTVGNGASIDMVTGAAYSDAGTVYEQIVQNVGDKLSGVGAVSTINQSYVTSLCKQYGNPVSCQITYYFHDYTVRRITAPTYDEEGNLLQDSKAYFTGGVVDLYLHFGSPIFNPTNTQGALMQAFSADIAAATSGIKLVQFVGAAVNKTGDSLVSTAQNETSFLNNTFAFSGLGNLDVNLAGGGVLASYFDTNTIQQTINMGTAANPNYVTNFNDASLTSFANTLTPTNGELVTGTVALQVVTSAPPAVPEHYYDEPATPVSEPGALALAGLGLLAGVAGSMRKRCGK